VGAPAMAGLGVEQHRVDSQRIDLPLPPVTAYPPAAIGAGTALEHQPLDTALATAFAEYRQRRPVAGLGNRTQTQRRLCGLLHHALKGQAPLFKGALPPVFAL